VCTYNRTCDDWYTNGHFCYFDCLLTVFDHWCANRHRSTKTVPTVYQQRANRQKQSKDSKNRENDHWCTNCHRSTKTVPTVYQQCTKTVKRQSKQQKSPLVYQSSHVYSASAEYTKPLHPDSVDGLLFVHGLKHRVVGTFRFRTRVNSRH